MNRAPKMRDLKQRINEIENSFAGTALHMSALHKDLRAFQARMEQRLDRALGRDGQFDRIERELRGLRAGIPKAVRRAAREALRKSGESVARKK
jgi:hypothetical protein